MFGAYLKYVTLFSSNIYILVICLFCVIHKTYMCYCSPWHVLFQKSNNMHILLFLSAVRLDPCHHPTRYPSSQRHNGIIQVLCLGIMIMFQLRHHRETACHSRGHQWCPRLRHEWAVAEDVARRLQSERVCRVCLPWCMAPCRSCLPWCMAPGIRWWEMHFVCARNLSLVLYLSLCLSLSLLHTHTRTHTYTHLHPHTRTTSAKPLGEATSRMIQI